MTTLIPRAEVDTVMERYGDDWPGSYDVPVETVRAVAKDCRRYADGTKPKPPLADLSPNQFRAEADDLDALADRYEREES
jgi:hypothetical protein